MSSIFETIGSQQVDVHYVTTGAPGRVEENFEEFYFEHDDHFLQEVLQDQETVYQSLQASNGNDWAKASASGSSNVNHGRSSGEDQDVEKEGESSHVADVEAQLKLDEALAISLQAVENQFLVSSLSESTETEAVNREVNSTNTSSQAVRQDNIEPDNMTYEALLSLGEDIGTESRGLSEDLISYLPKSKYSTGGFFSKKDKTEECVICFTLYKNRDKLITLPCQHQYHSKCITPWLKLNKACPVCKEEVFGS
ncbi:E3 ubiquitin-protein ligase BIG BROTHER-like isoform X2 [Telopea speciosissima]|uniref:E3 ubiquitin-protein ligase BIG BROTHER-like isoform X2 n=1 Tax=Telopea speciosissima TaxID=54955 RepID=UPI001CC6402E|nr:E3 ubiquitin-protein ligase BIG BROTHER-like isoform X2 [Telopea speciosissima]